MRDEREEKEKNKERERESESERAKERGNDNLQNKGWLEEYEFESIQ
jgi:hypothetical protein